MSIVPLDQARLEAALDELAARDAELAAALARLGYPAPRVREPGFATLLRVIAAQQLSTATAAALLRKLEAALEGQITAERFLALDDAALRATGFSARKVEYGRGLARAVVSGELPVERLHLLEDEEVIERLTALKGFGRWSAEIYLLFALGRVDSFPADDLALQIGLMRLKRLEARPTPKALRTLVEPWRPFRGAAAVFLWHYYGAATLDEKR